MSDEALNKHLEWMDECAEDVEMIEVEAGYLDYLEAELADWHDRRDEKFQMYEDCKAENEALRRFVKGVHKGPHHTAIDATKCPDLVEWTIQYHR